jgi:heme-degrading monooxygenase HmoA
VIARIWRGVVRRQDRDRYADYLRATGVKEYAETPGNRGVLMLRRDDGDRTEFVLVTLWESWDAVRAFAGDDVEHAVYYPEDDAYLLERDTAATHFEVVESIAPEPS